MNKHTIIWLHGLGANGDDFASLSTMLRLPAALETRFVFPDAPIIPITLNQGYKMRAWFDIYGLSAESKIDKEGIYRSRDSIAKLLEKEQARGVPFGNILLGGFSQGAAMALIAGLTFKEKLGGVIALSGFLPLAQEWFAAYHDRSLPIFLAHGKEDPVVSYQLGKMTHEALFKAGYPVSWRDYEGMPHTVSDQEMLDMRVWMGEILGF